MFYVALIPRTFT